MGFFTQSELQVYSLLRMENQTSQLAYRIFIGREIATVIAQVIEVSFVS
jgi:hypothetical protein